MRRDIVPMPASCSRGSFRASKVSVWFHKMLISVSGLLIMNHMAIGALNSVVAWESNDYGQTNVQPNLSNAVAIASRGFQNLALRNDGTVTAWGWGYYGQTNVPADLANVVAIAGGMYHNLALRNDGTVVAWGDNVYDQTNVPPDLTGVVAVAAG
jgi:hypothetical protein